MSIMAYRVVGGALELCVEHGDKVILKISPRQNFHVGSVGKPFVARD
jgi:hypothetical protein